MRSLLIFAAILLPVGVAWADDFTITLSAQDLSYIGGMLGKQPYNDVKPILDRLQAQIDKQNAAKAPPPPPAGAPADVKK